MANVKYDAESGAGYIRLHDGTPYEALEIGSGVYLHVDERGDPLQLEFLSLEELAVVVVTLLYEYTVVRNND